LKKPQASRRNPSKAGEDNSSRKMLLGAAKEEFARHGLHGSRVDRIAKAARINKQLIYYYFGDKENLYLAALEDAYRDIRAQESALDLGVLDPVAALAKLVGFTFDYVLANREFVLLLTNENLMEARHLKQSKMIQATRSPIVDLLGQILKRGEKAKAFRSGVDSVQLYISIAGLCFFYSANIHTLGILFGRDLQAARAVAERRRHVIDFALAALRPDGVAPRLAAARVGNGGARKTATGGRTANAG
jgi:TetR/AcrR family transcriptional regulator